MADRLSIFGGRDNQTVKIKGVDAEKLEEQLTHMREELQIYRYAFEKGVLGELTEVGEVNLDIDPDHEIEK